MEAVQAETFPVDINIEDVREAIRGRTDFREVTFEDHSVFVYFLGVGERNHRSSLTVFLFFFFFFLLPLLFLPPFLALHVLTAPGICTSE